MKNLILILLISIFFSSCGKSYYGYVYDFDSEIPLDGVIVFNEVEKTQVLTDNKGYFMLNYNKPTSELIFKKKGYIIARIKTISIQSGEFMEEKFKGEKNYLINTKSKTVDFRADIK